MSNKEILEKAIRKAIDGGWDNYEMQTEELAKGNFRIHDSSKINRLDYIEIGNNSFCFNVETLLYGDFGFAKALWGEAFANFSAGRSEDTLNLQIENWKGHLANMVIAEDPIKYLDENL